jgi:hypothetical protein
MGTPSNLLSTTRVIFWYDGLVYQQLLCEIAQRHAVDRRPVARIALTQTGPARIYLNRDNLAGSSARLDLDPGLPIIDDLT